MSNFHCLRFNKIFNYFVKNEQCLSSYDNLNCIVNKKNLEINIKLNLNYDDLIKKLSKNF